MHLLVLSAFRHATFVWRASGNIESQCTFWCSVLSDGNTRSSTRIPVQVSMHLLVLSAFRLEESLAGVLSNWSQCTFWCSVLSDIEESDFYGPKLWSLNAPFGAQCFPT